MRTCLKILLGTILTVCLAPLTAQAHWCNDLWSSSYNIVVRPATDTVTVPASGSASLDIFVQNNMGYQLPSFNLTATMGSTKLTASRQSQKVNGVLLPGEKAKYTLAITKTGGGSVAIGDISFSVSFGNSGQSGLYPAGGGKAVVIRQTDGTLVPSSTTGIGTGADQARQLQYAALADFSDANSGMDKLMSFYCAGRGSWGANDATVIAPACTGAATDCTKATRSVTGTGAGTKYDYTKLWAAVEMGGRKSGLGAARITTLRQRLQCGAADQNTTFAGLALMVLGYLGDDPAARTFLEGKVGTNDIGTIAKAALMLMSAADVTKYETDVRAGLGKGGVVGASCAAALGIAKLDDATVSSTLVPLVKWTEPDTGDNGAGLYAAHMLALTAWDRRGWAAKGADTGAVTFYEGGTPSKTGGSTAPSTGGSGGGSGGSTGPGGATGAGGAAGAGGKTVVASGGGSGGTLSGGGIASGGKMAAGGSSGTATGGTSVSSSGGTVTGSGGIAGTPTGGNTSAGAGGNTPAATGGAGANPNTAVATGGISDGSGGARPSDTGGGTGSGTGVKPGQGGQSGSGSEPAGAGSAGGCSYAPGRSIPLAFVLAGVGLALAMRRRRR